MTTETFTFQAEVSKLLDIVAHSLYSQKEIFLRELISNASDACDKLRYEALTNSKLSKGDTNFQISLRVNKKENTLTISDNGIGMERSELSDMLGTIARSGTQAFVDNLNAAKAKDKKSGIDLIGQFGVGFYSAFMVSDKIEVLTRKAGSQKSSLWKSNGQGEFTIEDASRETRGTDVILHLKKDDKEFLEPLRVENIVKTYSDHIGIPIVLFPTSKDESEKTLNTASALWTRAKAGISKEQYKEFYHHSAHAYDEPWMTLHNNVEGVLSYTNLLFIPSQAPMDLFNPERKTNVKLYVKRVFITDDCEGLLPPYLRFVKGIVDSEDLPLNISREMFQKNPALAKIKKALTRKILSELKKKAEKEPDDYKKFWGTFGSVLKEGLYEDFENREKLLEIVRFKTTSSDELVSLKSYLDRLKGGQDCIYYITGEDSNQTALSPQLEGFKAKDVEVLLLTDPVDEFWVTTVGQYEKKSFKSATQGGADLSKIAKDKKSSPQKKKKDGKTKPTSIDPLIAAFKLALGDKVKDVRTSERLTDSPVCLVAEEGDMDIHLERILKQHKQVGGGTPRILEVNADHPLVQTLNDVASKETGTNSFIEDAAWLFFDQARIVEGEKVENPNSFVRRMTSVMEKGLK